MNDTFIFSCFVHGDPFYYGVILPIALIIFVNLVILGSLIVVLARKRVVVGQLDMKKDLLSNIRIALSCTVRYHFLFLKKLMRRCQIVQRARRDLLP